MKSNRYQAISLIVLILSLTAIMYWLSQASNSNKSVQKLISKSNTLQSILNKNQEQVLLQSQNTNNNNLLTQERFYTQKEIDEITKEKFGEMIDEIERRLPKKYEIKEIPKEALHHTPAIIIEAGRNLGVIKEVIKIHENYEEMVYPFYERCSKNEETPTTVRALCLTNFILLKKKNNLKIELKSYPKELIELSKIITDL